MYRSGNGLVTTGSPNLDDTSWNFIEENLFCSGNLVHKNNGTFVIRPLIKELSGEKYPTGFNFFIDIEYDPLKNTKKVVLRPTNQFELKDYSK